MIKLLTFFLFCYYVFSFSGTILDLPTTFPSAEVCILGENSYEWHYASPLGPLTSSLHVGYGIDKTQYKKGIIAPITPLFNQLQLSITSAISSEYENQTHSKISSPLKTVNIYPKERNGFYEYNKATEYLIENELKSWNYSKNADEYDTTYFFLPSSSIGSSSFYNYKYYFDGIGILRYFSFLLSQSGMDEPRRFPSLWPWISAKLYPQEEISVSTHLLISQDVFTLSHTPAVEKNEKQTLFSRLLEDSSTLDYFPYKQMAYISDIKYGEQLFISINVTSTSPQKHPYFAKILIHAVKDLLTDVLPQYEFDETYPNVSFNISLAWNPITMNTKSGMNYTNISFLNNIGSAALLDIVDTWRTTVLHNDPLLYYPIALQARSLRKNHLRNYFSHNNDNHPIFDHTEDQLKSEYINEEIEDNNKDIKEETGEIEKGEEGNEEINNFHTKENEELSIDDIIHNHDIKVANKIYNNRIETGDIVKIRISQCAVGFLPPHGVLEMVKELSFITTLTAIIFIGLLTYLTFGGVINQIVQQGEWQLPFFLHIHELQVRFRLLYIWP